MKSQGRLAAPQEAMRAIQPVTERFADQLDTVYIRFPNDGKPLGGCDAGKIVYVFVDGTVGVCPYLVFAARTPQSRYPDTDFIVGNIVDADVAVRLDGYDFHQRFTVGANPTCGSCRMTGSCGKGCPAAQADPARGSPTASPITQASACTGGSNAPSPGQPWPLRATTLIHLLSTTPMRRFQWLLGRENPELAAPGRQADR